MESIPGGCVVTGVDELPSTVARLLDQKARRRRELARLPIEEKVRLVALMPRQENEVRRASGRSEKPVWPLPELEGSSFPPLTNRESPPSLLLTKGEPEGVGTPRTLKLNT
jgi:hypothetical protein